MKVLGVVYLIVNLLNGKMYVGQTIQPLKKRFYNHCHANSAIGNAIRKYKPKNFRCEILKCCATKTELDAWEKFFIAALRCKAPNGYNRTNGGSGNWRHTAESREKIASKLRGVKKSPEHRAKISASKLGDKNPNYGKPLSDEQKAKIATKLIGRKNPADMHGEKNPFFGKHHTSKTRTIISAYRRGKSPYKNLIAELDAHQLSYAMLAQLLGLSASNLARKIRGERNFTDKDKAKLEEIFGKSAEYLLQR